MDGSVVRQGRGERGGIWKDVWIGDCEDVWLE